MKIYYYYSACVGIETQDVSVLCDPWFSEGVYDGSWYHYPKFINPLEKIPRYDYVYVSHIHPDHYDPAFLKQYIAKHPDSKIIIAPFSKNYLSLKMKSDGITHEIASSIKKNNTEMILIPNESNPVDVDSVLVVKDSRSSVVNMNDNLFSEEIVQKVRAVVPAPTVALLGYTGAGPYPQTYFEETEILKQKAHEKKLAFFERYQKMAKALDAQVRIPFAGKYVLGGSLVSLNKYRGIADAVEILSLDPKAIVLADGGDAFFDTENMKANSLRTHPYDERSLESYLEEIKSFPMKYEQYFSGLPLETIPFARLLPKAFKNAHSKSTMNENYYFCIRMENQWFYMNTNRNTQESGFVSTVDSLSPRTEIKIDLHYLFGLITAIFHWNNAEVGSQYFSRRQPDIFNREAQGFLNFFHL